MKSENVKRLLDMLAYLSLGLDICIAGITAMSIFNISADGFLGTVNVLLTVVVALSIGLFATLIILKRVEGQMVARR